MAVTLRPVHHCVLLWGLVVAAALFARPLLPVDETRYLAVAWDMWLEGNYLVPHLNGEPYSHKPPLLFWLMTAGWHVFGINEWWPRLVAPLFGLGAVLLTGRLAGGLWPERPDVAATASYLLIGGLFWAIFTTLTMFDMMLAFFAVAALAAMIEAARTGRLGGLALAGLMVGLGVLTKGPAILVHYLPAALTAPWWAPRLAAAAPDGWTWRRWYGGVILSVFLAAAVGLAWAVPAGIAGGEAYREAIFWGQSAGRVVNSFAHARPFWWYAAALPGLILPWLIWPPAWRRAGLPGGAFGDGAARLCLIWFGAAFLAFSAVSGKQLHYLLPEFPALALLAAYLTGGAAPRRLDSLIPGGFFVVLGAALLAAPYLPVGGRLGATLAEAHTMWAGLVLAAGAAVIVRRGRAAGLAAAAAVSIAAVHLAARPVLAARYDLAPVAAQVRAHQDSGRSVANFGKYHGQYHFLGRLARPVRVIGQARGDEQAFLKAHPGGVVVAYHRTLPARAEPLFTHPYRRMTVAIWPAQTVIDHPGIAERR